MGTRTILFDSAMFNPYFAVVLATVIWGSAGVFIKYLNLPPTTIAFFRAFVPAIILYYYFTAKRINPFSGNLKLIFLASSIGVIEFPLYFVAYSNTSITNSVIILYTWPIFAAALSVFFLKEKLSKRNVLLFLVAFIGVIFVYAGNKISLSDKDFIGVSSMLLAAILVASTIVIFKKLSSTHSSYEIVFYHNFISGIVFIPFVILNKPFPTTTQSAVAILYALLIGLLAYIPYYYGLKHLKASTLSLLSYLEVVSGILFGIMFFAEELTLKLIIGGLMIMGSVLLIKNK